MSPFFIFGLIALILGVSWILFAPAQKTKVIKTNQMGEAVKTKQIPSFKPWGFIPVLLGVVFVILSCFATVGTNSVGVGTQFKATTGATYEAGLVVKSPFTNVTDIDCSIQTQEYHGKSAIGVKIADGGTADVSMTYRWRCNPDGADTIFKDYRKYQDDEGGITEAVRKALVSTNIKAALNESFGSYDPFDGVTITADMTAEQLASIKLKLPDPKVFNQAVKDNVEEKIKSLGNLIEIQSVSISFVKLPDGTQKRIDLFNDATNGTKLALQDVATKKAQAAANKALAESLQDPNVLVSKCLDGMISGDIKAPAGFQCFNGAGGSVVIPSAPAE